MRKLLWILGLAVCQFVFAAEAPISPDGNKLHEVKKGTPAPDGTLSGSQQSRLVLPEVVYAVPGVESNLYFDNVFLCVNPDNFVFDVNCLKGRNYRDRWSFIPTDKEIGTYPLTLTVIGENGVVAKGETKVVVAPADAGKGKDISLLIVGDSLTNATVYPTRIHSLTTGENNRT